MKITVKSTLGTYQAEAETAFDIIADHIKRFKKPLAMHKVTIRHGQYDNEVELHVRLQPILEHLKINEVSIVEYGSAV